MYRQRREREKTEWIIFHNSTEATSQFGGFIVQRGYCRSHEMHVGYGMLFVEKVSHNARVGNS